MYDTETLEKLNPLRAAQGCLGKDC